VGESGLEALVGHTFVSTQPRSYRRTVSSSLSRPVTSVRGATTTVMAQADALATARPMLDN